jgi:DNA polymerase-3 subunit beta
MEGVGDVGDGVMKTTVSAGALASALALAAKLSDDAATKRIAALTAVRLEADGAALTVSGNVLDLALTLTRPAEVERGGALAVNAAALAALTSTFPSEVAVAIEDHSTSVRITCGRSRYTLAAIPVANLPPVPVLGEAAGHVELAREQAAALFARVSFAVSTEKARNYLCGVLLHDTPAGLTSVATDSYQLACYTIAGGGGLSSDYRLIVPTPAEKIIGKLLASKNIERVALRCSGSLFAVEATNLAFTTKLIDGPFPDYARFIPAPTGNGATVNRTDFKLALERIAAVANGYGQRRTAGLRWNEGDALHLCHTDSDAADDMIAAEVTGTGTVAAQTDLLLGALDIMSGERVRLDNHDSKEPLRITDSDDSFLALIMPVFSDRAAARAA